MKTSEKVYLENTFHSLIEKLIEQKIDDLQLQGWPEPGLSKLKILKTRFNSILDDIVRYCEDTFLANIDKRPDFGFWQNRARNINDFILFVRTYKELLFPAFTFQLSNLFKFIDDILATFPDRSKLNREEIVILVPTGKFSAVPFERLLSSKVQRIVPQERTSELKEIYFVECVSKLRLDYSAVLSHEIIHVLIYKNFELMQEFFFELSQQDDIKQFFELLSLRNPGINRISHLLEYFCDFTSSWHIGPIFARSFSNEIEYYPKLMSDGHPPSILRIKLLLISLGKDAPVELKELYESERVEIARILEITDKNDIKIVELGLREISNRFAVFLEMKFQMLKFENQKASDNILLRYIEHNLPYLYKDIRSFLNNLPNWKDVKNKLEEKELDITKCFEFYNNFLEESIVRSNAFRIFQSGVESLYKGVTLPLPKAFIDG